MVALKLPILSKAKITLEKFKYLTKDGCETLLMVGTHDSVRPTSKEKLEFFYLNLRLFEMPTLKTWECCR